MLRANVGGFDRAVRLAVGPVLLVAGLWAWLAGAGPQAMVMTVIGVLLLLTGLTRFCILYVPFGISTARRPAGRGAGL